MGSLPFSYLGGWMAAGVDLRLIGTGTVSGSGLYEVAGFGPLAAAGILDVAKGAVGPALAGRDRPLVAAAAAAAAVSAHNWSPWLRGAGGRGLSPALGATLVAAPEATVALLASMVIGRMTRRSGTVTLAGMLGVVPLLAWRRQWPGMGLALAVAGPMIVKRLAGNRPLPADRRGAALRARLLYDRDP